MAPYSADRQSRGGVLQLVKYFTQPTSHQVKIESIGDRGRRHMTYVYYSSEC